MLIGRRRATLVIPGVTNLQYDSKVKIDWTKTIRISRWQSSTTAQLRERKKHNHTEKREREREQRRQRDTYPPSTRWVAMDPHRPYHPSCRGNNGVCCRCYEVEKNLSLGSSDIKRWILLVPLRSLCRTYNEPALVPFSDPHSVMFSPKSPSITLSTLCSSNHEEDASSHYYERPLRPLQPPFFFELWRQTSFIHIVVLHGVHFLFHSRARSFGQSVRLGLGRPSFEMSFPMVVQGVEGR